MGQTTESNKNELKSFLPNASELQVQIFENWKSNLIRNNPEISGKDLTREILYLFYPSKCLLTTPFSLPEIEKVIPVIHDFFKNKSTKRMVLYTDRDADGITSSTILYLFFIEKMGIPKENLVVLFPDEEDKYGITEQVVDKIVAQKPDVLITLDCGSSNRESLLVLSKKITDIQIIVMDHHFMPESIDEYPQVNAFINPMMLSNSHPHRWICTAGLAYLFIWAVTYSFTQEFDTIHGIEKNTFVKNGILQNIEHDSVVKDWSENNEDEISSLWEYSVKENRELFQIDKFVSDSNIKITSHEKFWILKNIRMKQVDDRIKSYLALAGIGTIADSMLLYGSNRVIVNEGLNQINESKESLPIGLKEIIKASGFNGKPLSVSDLAFFVCPAINAPGRLGNASVAFDALVSTDPLESAEMAFKVKKMNEQRKVFSKEAVETIDNELVVSSDDAIVVAYHEKIHRGISGIVASKLAEKYQKPAIVMVHDGDCIRGSARAYEDENVLSIIQDLSPWFIQFGGHLQAAGFSLDHTKKSDFTQAALETAKLTRQIWKKTEKENNSNDLILLNESQIHSGLWKEIQIFAPFGPGNPHPVFDISIQGNIKVNLMGTDKTHARVNFSGISNTSIEGVWFFHNGKVSNLTSDQNLHIIAEPHMSYFAGKTVYQLKIIKSY